MIFCDGMEIKQTISSSSSTIWSNNFYPSLFRPAKIEVFF